MIRYFNNSKLRYFGISVFGISVFRYNDIAISI